MGCVTHNDSAWRQHSADLLTRHASTCDLPACHVMIQPHSGPLPAAHHSTDHFFHTVLRLSDTVRTLNRPGPLMQTVAVTEIHTVYETYDALS